jgi:hypothetical protein
MPNMSNVNPRHYQPPQQQEKAESIQYFGQPQAQVIRGRTTVASFGTPQQHHTLNISSPPPQTIISSPPQAVVSSPPLARAPKLPIYPLAKEGIPLQQLPALEKLARAPLQQFSLQVPMCHHDDTPSQNVAKSLNGAQRADSRKSLIMMPSLQSWSILSLRLPGPPRSRSRGSACFLLSSVLVSRRSQNLR